MPTRLKSAIPKVAVATLSGIVWVYSIAEKDESIFFETNQTISNWSSTHTCHPHKIYYPENSEQIDLILKQFSSEHKKIRVIGTGLSPNAIGMTENGHDLISLAHMNKISINLNNLEVTVDAGVTVSEVLKELQKYGLTLQNFSSIQEQQIGGWTQVAAHGTGATFSTVDEMIIELEVITPSQGRIILNHRTHPDLFQYVKVGLGNLGIVTKVTLKCIPEITLKEETTVINRDLINSMNHVKRLQNYRHVRYMWLPYTDAIVNVVSNPYQSNNTTHQYNNNKNQYNNNNDGNNDNKIHSTNNTSNQTHVHNHSSVYESNTPNNNKSYTNTDTVKKEIKVKGMEARLYDNNNDDDDDDSATQRLQPFTEKLLPTKPLYDLVKTIYNHMEIQNLQKLTFSQLRDILLDYDPLNIHHIMNVNTAESKYWMNSQGNRIDKSVNILGFDCGGEQWVYEVCIPIGSIDELEQQIREKKMSKDIEFMKKLLDIIEKNYIPAPCPIEQRWTSASHAVMSPAYSINKNDIFTWVGVIMYLPPSQSDSQRQEITRQFRQYCQLIEPLVHEYKGYPHWAKLEVPTTSITSTRTMDTATEQNKVVIDMEALRQLRQYLRKKYPIEQYNIYRHMYDPHNILTNNMMSLLFDDRIDKDE